MTIRTGEWIAEAWELVKQDFWMHALVALIFCAVNGTGVGFLIVGPLTCGYQYMIIRKLTRPQQGLELNDLGKGFDVFVDSFVAWLLIGVFVGLGMLACIVGSVIVWALLLFTLPLIIDRRMKFWDAICASYDRTKTNWFGVTLFVFLLGLLVGLIALLTCGLGYFVAFPLQNIAVVLAYRDNFGLAQVEKPTPPAPSPIPPPA